MKREFSAYLLLVASAGLALMACGGVSEESRAGSTEEPVASSDDRGGAGPGSGGPSGAGPSAPDPWSIRAVASGVGSLDQVSLMLDRDRVPHIAYSQAGDLWHAWLRDGEFASEQVDSYGRGWHKEWVAGSPDLRLVYSSFLFHGAVFQAVRAADGSWLSEVDDLSDQGAAVSGVWSDGRAKVARLSVAGEYSSGSPLLQGVVFDGEASEAAIRPTLEDTAVGLALALDRLGTAHIVYASPSDDVELGVLGVPKTSLSAPFTVRYISVSDGRWSEPENLGLGAGWYSGLAVAIDAESRLHVTFAGPSKPVAFVEASIRDVSITHLRRDPGAPWHREVVPSTGTPTLGRNSLALDAEGDVHLVYQANLSDERSDLVHVRQLGGTWSAETIRAGTCRQNGGDANLAFGANGSLHTAFQGCDGELVYATRAAF